MKILLYPLLFLLSYSLLAQSQSTYDNFFNAFYGAFSGNTDSSLNTAGGHSNVRGLYNTFIGGFAGYRNTGSYNTSLGSTASFSNTTGSNNTTIGHAAGYNSTTASYNVFVGQTSGQANITGANNSFLGQSSGFGNTTGTFNTFLGYGAGYLNTIGSQNTFIGTGAGVSASNPGLQNATAIGYNASVTVSNALILGNAVNVGIGTTAPANKLEITQGTAGNSGLRLTNLTSASPASVLNQTKFLTVDASGNVILAAAMARHGWVLRSPLGAEGRFCITGMGEWSLVRGEQNPAGYSLYVSQGLLTEQVKVAVKNTDDWSDKVFAPGYRLAPLGEVAQYIQQHQHLPGVSRPSRW